MTGGGRASTLVVITRSADGALEIWAHEDPEGRTYFQLRLVGLDGLPLAPPWLADVNFALKSVRRDVFGRTRHD